jgi:hypothetical protein
LALATAIGGGYAATQKGKDGASPAINSGNQSENGLGTSPTEVPTKVATQVPTQSPTEVPTPVPPTPEPQVAQTEQRWNEFPGVSEEDKQYIHEGVDMALPFYEDQLGFKLPRLSFNVLYDEKTSPYPAQTTFASVTIINTAHPEWVSRSPILKRETAAHELLHQFQIQETQKSFDSMGPFWIFEGAAEYAGFQAIVNKGLMTNDEVIASRKNNIRGIDIPPINSVTNDTPARYNIALLAVDFLMNGRGLKPYGEYLKNLTHNDWQSSFEFAFGETPDQFEARFQQYRAQNGIS